MPAAAVALAHGRLRRGNANPYDSEMEIYFEERFA
jgi:hypothetical protein